MATAVNIVLADALATPVNHTFIPLGKDAQGVFWFEDQSQVSPIGYWRISAELKRPLPGGPNAQSSSDRVARVKLTLHEPALETLGTSDSGLTPPATIAYISRVSTEYVLPERGSIQNRKDLRKMNSNLQENAQVVAMVENLIPVY